MANEADLNEAVAGGADSVAVVFRSSGDEQLIESARKLSPKLLIVVSGAITLESVRSLAEAGADLIRVDALTQSIKAANISFQIQPG